MRGWGYLVTAGIALLLARDVAGAERSWWLDDARPSPQAMQAVELLADAASHGLEPRDYDAETLRAAMNLARERPLDSSGTERLDRALSAAVERFLDDVHRGRLRPPHLPQGYAEVDRPPFDAAAVLRTALVNRRLLDAVREVAPQLPQYDRLRAVLKDYRALAQHPAWQSPLPPLPSSNARGGGAKLEPGVSYSGLAQLRARLTALGDLAVVAPAADVFDDAMASAVMSFQSRHGLAVDGVVGKATLAHLEVTPAARVRQIELMLERLRWTPLLRGSRMVVINIPEFTLRAYEIEGGRIAVRETMRVIVGKAMNTRTPLFAEDMRTIEFQPYWNVPPSIARGEIIPRLRRDPGYFDREGFEFVAGGVVHRELAPALLDAVRAGQARIRQRPGPRNALGDIKFVFPNHNNIYLHHTPSVQLFARDRRDFSHGCIRVEQPVALAKFVLAGMAGWNEERIRQAMSDADPMTVRLKEPLPVLIAYGTAMVKSGRVHFFEDIYGLDRTLDAALRQPRPVAGPTAQ